MSRAAVLVSVLAALLVTAGWYLLLVKPVQDTIIDTEDQMIAAVEEERTLRAQRAVLQKIEDNMLSYLTAIGDLERSIPPSPQTASLIDDLSALAVETGVVWDAGAYGNPTQPEGEDYFEIPVNVSIQGQFFEVLGYLYGMAELDRLVRIESLAITPAQDDDGFTTLSVTINARAFTSADVLVPDDATEGKVDETPADEPPTDRNANRGRRCRSDVG